MNIIKQLRNCIVDTFVDLTTKVRNETATWKETCEWCAMYAIIVFLVFSAFSIAVYILFSSLDYYETV